MLTVLDEDPLEALCVAVKQKMNSEDVLGALCPSLLKCGKPEYILTDNVLYAELLADLASVHYRIEVSRHVHSMA